MGVARATGAPQPVAYALPGFTATQHLPLPPSCTPCLPIAVFALPQLLWPVLPPGAFYVLEGGHDPRASYTYLQHSTFPDIRVRGERLGSD